MNHQTLYKGITIFSLALGFGTFTGDVYDVKEISENVSNEVQSVEKKNCRFADPNLTYQNLPLKNENYNAKLIAKPKVLSVPADKSNDKNEAKKSQDDLNKEIEKIHSESKKQTEIKNKEEYSTLLHMEICSESDGRK